MLKQMLCHFQKMLQSQVYLFQTINGKMFLYQISQMLNVSKNVAIASRSVHKLQYELEKVCETTLFLILWTFSEHCFVLVTELLHICKIHINHYLAVN